MSNTQSASETFYIDFVYTGSPTISYDDDCVSLSSTTGTSTEITDSKIYGSDYNMGYSVELLPESGCYHAFLYDFEYHISKL